MYDFLNTQINKEFSVLQKRIFENYKSIRLFPDKFNDFLLHEVGFSTSEKLVTPSHTSRGFQRPIIIYTKVTTAWLKCRD